MVPPRERDAAAKLTALSKAEVLARLGLATPSRDDDARSMVRGWWCIALSLIAPTVASASSTTTVVLLKPVDGHGALMAGFTVAKTGSGGACSSEGITLGSEIVQGALTCTHGHGLYDPCWQEGQGDVTRVLCITDAWRRVATRIVLKHPAEPQRSDGSRSLSHPDPHGRRALLVRSDGHVGR